MSVRLTEQPSLYDHLETKSVAELLRDINTEDKKVPLAIEAVLPDIEKLVCAIEERLRAGGRFFWLYKLCFACFRNEPQETRILFIVSLSSSERIGSNFSSNSSCFLLRRSLFSQ